MSTARKRQAAAESSTPRRAQRRAEQERRRQEERRRKFYIAGGVVIALALAIGLYLSQRDAEAKLGVSVPNEGAGHVAEGTPIEYKQHPPASGSHYPSPRAWGVYDEPVAAGYWVHNLEHGGIVLLYQCSADSCASEAEKIRGLSRTLPPSKWQSVKLLATPYDGIDTPYMLVAWDRQLSLSTFDETTIRAFYEAYVDRGPEDVP